MLDKRFWLGVFLIVMAVLYKGGGSSPDIVNPKLEKPSDEYVALVADVSVSDGEDASKLAGVFKALSEGTHNTTLASNLQVQYFLHAVGMGSVGNELDDKYPDLSSAVVAALTNVLGPQNSDIPITDEKKRNLAKLFHALAWKLYSSSHEDVYDSYKAKALLAVDAYNNVDPEPDTPIDDCPCEGKGYIVHGDGHKTDCPCVAAGRECNCESGDSGTQCQCDTGCNCDSSSGCKCSVEKPEATEGDGVNNSSPTATSSRKRRGLFRGRR